MKPKGNPNPDNKEQKDDFPGYPHHSDEEDIYKKQKDATNVDPDDPTRKKSKNPPTNKPNELDFEDNLTGGDLDVPGTELDDAQENIGSEDEENNYYSLGGDNHDK